MGSNQLHVVWDNHISNLQAVLYEFYNRHSLADVTISCKDGTLKAHKIILSACSPYFESVFQENPCEHPVVILKEISCYEMQILLQLMYRGSTDVLEENISDIIQTANELKVKGFVQAAVKNVTEDTGRLENDSGMYQRNSPSSDDDSELHILKDVGHNEERYDLQDDVDSCDSVVLINNVIPTSDQVYKPTSDVNHSAMIFAPSSMEQTLETAYGQNRQTGEDVRTNNCGEDFLAEVRCKSMKRQQGKNDLKARKKVVEFQDSLSWSSEDEKTLSDQPRLTIASLNDETTLNVISTVDASIKQKSNLADKSARKDKFIHIIPNIQIKEEQIGAVDYSVVSTHCDKRNYKHTETVKQSACGNPADTHLPCIDISDVTSLVRRNEIPLKPHECEFCGLSFARAAHLARHRRVHTGERPFTCCLCQRTFTRQDKLRLHVLKYHGPHVKDAKHLTYLLTQKVAGSANNAAIEDDLRETGRGDSSLPFGDTSYLSSLSFGQQKYADSAVSATETLDSNADELLYSVRQLGECTIKAVVKQELNS